MSRLTDKSLTERGSVDSVTKTDIKRCKLPPSIHTEDKENLSHEDLATTDSEKVSAVLTRLRKREPRQSMVSPSAPASVPVEDDDTDKLDVVCSVPEDDSLLMSLARMSLDPQTWPSSHSLYSGEV